MGAGIALLYGGYALLWWGVQLWQQGAKSPPLLYALLGLGNPTR